MADVVYNPLLKRNIQYFGGDSGDVDAKIAALQNDINDLQSRLNDLKGLKITKVTATSQLSDIENNEIFEWQAETQTVEGVDFVNGYFYKKTIGQQTLPSGTSYFLYNAGSPIITQNNYVFAPDNYYILNTITPDNSSNFFNFALYQWNGIQRYYFVTDLNGKLLIGDLVWDNQNLVFVTVTNIDEILRITLSNGDVLSGGATGGVFVAIFECKTADGTEYNIIRTNSGRIVVHYTLVDNVFSLIDWFYVPLFSRTTTSPQIIGVDTYTRTNTQPSSSYTLPIAAANVLGGVKVGNNLSIDANGVLSASGSSYNLPIAAANVLGGVKVGSGLSIDANGVLSSSGGSSTVLTCDVSSSNAKLDISSYSVFFVNGLMFFSCYFDVSASISRGEELFEPLFDADYGDVYSISFLISDFPLLFSSNGNVSLMNVAIWPSNSIFQAQATIAIGSYAIQCVLPVSLTLES